MSDFYLGFWWCFPALMAGFLIGWYSAKKKGKAENDCFGEAVIFTWAILGCLTLFSGYPVFEAVKLFR
ncbi:hypothetical protein G3495_23240 [Shewanella baltica]|uniref:hypothetical protein n=1 Tax=Shewanella baltica TaxID=62322 RepID=UPI00217E2EF7|nr:hypothetical protein [Shewanella baltica]MCS6237977.1 hypothetical protein [Shewanella baltica]